MKRPKAPEPTAQELAVVERQSRQLDEEMEENEKRLKAIARGKLGSKSLLAKAGSAKGMSRTGTRTGARTGSMMGGFGAIGGGVSGNSGIQSTGVKGKVYRV